MPCTRKSTIASALTVVSTTLSSLSSVPTYFANETVTASMTTVTAQPSATSSADPSASSAAGATGGYTTYAGVNIAGLDFGCSTDGTCAVASATFPATGAAQMQHFATNDQLNVFRLAVSWQFLTNHTAGGDLDATNFGRYNQLMTSCLDTGAKCVLDIHNYARWDGGIIGQGGPTDDDFAALWTSLAVEYANNTNVILGIMNEPHHLDIPTWAQTVQAAVTAIRSVAPDHMILMPGSSYSSAGTLSTEAGPDLLNVANPDGSTTNLFFDVHKYLDADNSGTSTECVATNDIDAEFTKLATWLRGNGRQAMLSETGGGNTASCQELVCQELAFLNDNADVFLGYIGWAAGAFSSSYALSLTPSGTTADAMTDTALMTSCFAR